MSKEKTTEEIRTEFIEHVRGLVRYWNRIEGSSEEKLNGLAFSILGTLDGVSGGICGFVVAPGVHEDDKQYHIDNDEDYYPDNNGSDIKGDISGSLHELFYKK